MKTTRKVIPWLAATSSLLLAAVMVIGAAAAPDPFKGQWRSTDTDGSTQTLRIGGGPDGSYHIVYYDDGATVCGLDENGDFLAAASAVGRLGPSGDTISGLAPVYCMASPRYLYDLDVYFEYTYQAGTDTLLDVHGVTWSRWP